MSELFRDTVVGQLLRLVTGRRILQFPEERDSSIWQKYLNPEKSANMAIHGSTAPPSAEEKDADVGLPADQEPEPPSGDIPTPSSASTSVDYDNVLVNTLSGTRIDPEKGRDAHIVDW